MDTLKKWCLKQLMRTCYPKHYRTSYAAWKVLAQDYGHIETIRHLECRDAQGHPIPWYTYPAIDYLNQMDLSTKTIFEYGCGFSTVYWAHRGKHVVAIDDNPEWYDRIKRLVSDKVTLHLVRDLDLYPNAIASHTIGGARPYDIIIIDGKKRYLSALASVEYLRSDGFMILDNADWFQNTVHMLMERGLRRVDFIGLGPINAYTWNTCFFFGTTCYPRFFPDMHITGNINQTSKEDLPS